MSEDPTTDRPCRAVEIPPGPAGLEALLGPLIKALTGTGPAIGLVPSGGSLPYRERIAMAVRPGEPVPRGVAVVVSTSGSTGNPAGVLLPETALRAATAGFAQRSGYRQHLWVAALPLHHVGGFMVAVRSVVGGTVPVAMEGLAEARPFSVHAFVGATKRAGSEASAQGLPLAVSLVPAMVATLDRAGGDAVQALRAYDAVLVGGAGTPPELAQRLRLAGVRLMLSYGMTETCGGVVFDGRPLAGGSVSVGPGGRLRVEGPQVAAGYRDGRNPERWGRTARGDRTFITEDLGEVSPAGEVRVLGRSDDVVQVGGASVSVGAVADTLRSDDRVSAAEVVAVPDARVGAILVALVVPTRGACVVGKPSSDGASGLPLGAALADRVSTELGRSARPRHVRLVKEIPMLESGKPDRQALARLANMAVI